MGSHKSRDDQIYEEGVHDGQQADLLDQVSHSMVKSYSLNARESEIYNRGYDFGVNHRPAVAARRSAPLDRSRGSGSDADSDIAYSGNTGCGQLIAILIGGGLVIAVALWFLANVILPVGLLNSAAILTILAVIFEERKTLFAGLALAGAGYMLVDIANGWLSATFVNHIVHTATWLTAFVYLNAAAAGASTWILVGPLVVKASSERDRLKTRLLAAASIVAIASVAFIPPLVYEFAPNPFRTSPLESTTASAPPPPGHEDASFASGEMGSQFVGTWRRPEKADVETGYLGIDKRSDGTLSIASKRLSDGYLKADGPPKLVDGRRVGGAFSYVRFENGHLYAKYHFDGMDSIWEEDYDLMLQGSETIVCAITGAGGKVVQLLHRETPTAPHAPSATATNPYPETIPQDSGDKLSDQAVIDDPDGYTNVRSGRSTSSVIVAVVRAGEVFSTSRQAGTWWRVRTASGQLGFMHASRIRLRH
jgi:hypothetical protein